MLLATAVFALGAPDVRAAAPNDHATAEYNRVSQQLKELAERNAWGGVERTYRELRGFGVPLSFDDHMGGARSARALGDVTSLRQRLRFAKALAPGNDEVEGWLAEIKKNYGEVSLLCDPGKADLVRDGVPFDPNQAAAMRFAQSEIERRGEFTGLIPAGHYSFDQFSFDVQAGMQAGTYDVRSDGYIRAQERAERARTGAPPPSKKKKKDEAE
ncbi:MAG: hypothetical protein EP330_28910 [Deltaproteobacteria bacterium]|nr:MAG: hypothetical protein EP330_28910 [Deltaproteobacteria bacterium]